MNEQTKKALWTARDIATSLLISTEHKYTEKQASKIIAFIDEALAQPSQEPAYIYDLEAISWALDKLAKFGVTHNSVENALMADRLQLMLYQAPDTHPAPAQDCHYGKDVGMPEYSCAGKCQYAQPAQEPNDWIEWHGGEQPVYDYTKVEVEIKSGRIFKCDAGDMYWGNKNIVRYRIAKEQL